MTQYKVTPPAPFTSRQEALDGGWKYCPRCERWLRWRGKYRMFRVNGRYPSGKPKLDGWCKDCRNRKSAAYYAAHRERQREKNAERYRERRADPAWVEHMRGLERERARRYRAENPDGEAERQRRYRQRIQADPVRAEEFRAKRREWYHEGGGRELVAATKVRRAMRQRFMAILLACLRVELARREGLAREGRERKRAYQRAWIARRRELMEHGELVMPSVPEYVNGELVRLPAGPLAVWLAARNVDEVANDACVHAKTLRRYTSGESVMVPLEVVDAIVTRTDAFMWDIYDPGEFPGLYED